MFDSVMQFVFDLGNFQNNSGVPKYILNKAVS